MLEPSADAVRRRGRRAVRPAECRTARRTGRCRAAARDGAGSMFVSALIPTPPLLAHVGRERRARPTARVAPDRPVDRARRSSDRRRAPGRGLTLPESVPPSAAGTSASAPSTASKQSRASSGDPAAVTTFKAPSPGPAHPGLSVQLSPSSGTLSIEAQSADGRLTRRKSHGYRLHAVCSAARDRVAGRRIRTATWREIDGTMAFVDISGFTAMSEKLATRGQGRRRAGDRRDERDLRRAASGRVRLRRRPAQVRRRRAAPLLRRRRPRAARGAGRLRDAEDAALDRAPARRPPGP